MLNSELDTKIPKGPATPTRHTDRKTILVVEKDESVRLVIARILARDGFTVLEADDAPLALEIVREHRDNLCMVIVDSSILAGSGADLVRWIVASRPMMKALLMNYLEGSPILANSQIGFVQMPFGPGELLSQVRGLLSRGDSA